MASFVLVHGAWVGGWIWGRVRPLLAAEGHAVFTPTLTGLGERAHLATPDTSLDTHIADILGVLEYEDLHKVVLVGSSYGGMVISGVAERATNRLAHLVYLDAFVPDDGKCVADYVGPETMAQLQQSAQAGNGWAVPMIFPLPSLGLTAETDLRWVNHRFTPQPLKTFATPVRLQSPEAAALPRSFIHCTRPAFAPMLPFAATARAARYAFHEMPTGHAAAVTAPKELAAILLQKVPERVHAPATRAAR